MDLLTQLQDKLDHLFLVFGTCIGVLQRDAPPSSFSEVMNNQPPQLTQEQLTNADNWNSQTKHMALQVIETTKLIESIIESLPGFQRTENEQYQRLKALNHESKLLQQQLQDKENENDLFVDQSPKQVNPLTTNQST
ncbi:putative mediator complex subunit 21 [Cavenderia fasciculata]|uniref:Mediator of RNA polymerase II transcription subunit 21 n=1 Tax=Cavenderia fasciculata TaxID=261658 RepID=F4QEG4_CACFS|nr:putative mediator complex subunit 21 [Cavenderia fasciculata]EGG13277.1 putative mediator complex subunit 21 [Cavenderia fasciculata]|eukprot:XP_004349976.1 putative mediator complex subunit 21 [Cavenderia fasciculata]